jgi:hypothetical protein
VVTFLGRHLGYPVPSPALFNKIGTAFRKAVNDYAEANDIPMVRFKKGDRKADVMKPVPSWVRERRREKRAGSLKPTLRVRGRDEGNDAEDFQHVKATAESLTSAIFLFE